MNISRYYIEYLEFIKLFPVAQFYFIAMSQTSSWLEASVFDNILISIVAEFVILQS